MLADRDRPVICAFRADISAAQRIGWDITTRQLSPVVTAEGVARAVSLSAARTRITASLQN